MSYNLKKIVISTIIPLLIILTFLSLGILIPILTMVLFGAILAYYIRFISKKINYYIKNNTVSVLLGIILFSIPIVLLLYFTLTQFVIIAESTFGSLQQAATGNSSTNMVFINQTVNNLNIPGNITDSLINTVQSGIKEFISFIAGTVVIMISSIPSFAAEMLILIFSVFYFARDEDKIISFITDVIPVEDIGFYQELFDSGEDVLKSIVVGNAIPAIILGIFSGFLYYFLGYPYALLLAIISGIAMFIPIIGPWVIYGVIGIISILIGNTIPGLLVIIFGWIIETTTDFYIRPKIAVQYSEIHPLIFLLGFIYGAVTMGIPGLFIGPLILGITYAAYKIYRKEKLKVKSSKLD